MSHVESQNDADATPADMSTPYQAGAYAGHLKGLGTTYQIVKAGRGAVIQAGDTVTVHATGIVKETGKQFWSTHDDGQKPFEYQAGVGKVGGHRAIEGSRVVSGYSEMMMPW